MSFDSAIDGLIKSEIGDIVFPENEASFVFSKNGYLCPSCGMVASLSRTKPPAKCRECGYNGVDDENGYMEMEF